MNTALLDALALAALDCKGRPNSLQWWMGAGYAQSQAEYAVKRGLAWCGVFALERCHVVGLLASKRWQVGRGFLLTPPPLRRVTDHHELRAGHILYHHVHQHHAIVADGDCEGGWQIVNGNGWGGLVSLSHLTAADLGGGGIAAFDPSEVA